MIFLLWSLLNLFLILSFYYFTIGLIVRGRKFLASYFKPYVLFVMVFGTYGFVKSASKYLQQEAKVNHRASTIQIIPVSEQLSNKLILTLIRDAQTGEVDQKFSSSDLQGLVLGLRWNHVQVVEKTENMEVEGWWDWYLMGNRVFSNYEIYEIGDKDLIMN